MKGATVAAAVMVALIAGAVGGYLYGSASSSAAPTGVPMNASVLSANGLRLMVSINATTLTPDEWIEITASLYNAGSNSINATANADDYQFLGYHLSPIGARPGPYLFVVLNGSYTPQTLVGLGGRGLAENEVFTGSSSAKYYLFPPHSDFAIVPVIACEASCETTTGTPSSSVSVVVRGFWAVPVRSNNNPSPPNSLVPGAYTVAIEDEWGDVLALHFTVLGQSPGAAPGACWLSEEICSG